MEFNLKKLNLNCDDENNDTFDTENTVLINSKEQLQYFEEYVEDCKYLAVDFEGVNLSRFGEITVVSIGVEQKQQQDNIIVYLFDLIDLELKDIFIKTIKSIMEDKNINKIIHDCRYDSDALFAQFNITLTSVFDTSIWDMEIRESKDRKNLNDTLFHYGCSINESRSKGRQLYIDNPNYWKERPIIQEKIKYASQDVYQLFNLKNNLVASAESKMPHRIQSIHSECNDNISIYRSCTFTGFSPVPKSCFALIIGTKGSGIRKIESAVNGAFVQDKCRDSSSGFMIIAKSTAQVKAVQDLIANQLKNRFKNKNNGKGVGGKK